MKIEHKQIVKEEIKPGLAKIQERIGEMDRTLRIIRRDGQGSDMTKMTIVINKIEEAVAGIKLAEGLLEDLLQKEEVSMKH